MKTQGRLWKWIVSVGLFIFLWGGWAGEAHAAAAKPAAPPKPQQLRGSVVSSDEKMVVVRVRKGEEVKFSVTSESRFGAKGEIKTAADFKPGNHVEVTYIRSRGGRILKQIVTVVKHIN